jgi:peptidoglycan/xylan/chitin deacetylase (PgdA/CDA1 family)
MYHSIADENEAQVHPYYRTATSPQQFALQMRYLHSDGYRTSSLAELSNQVCGRAPFAEKCVVLTFDDGYSNFYRHAFPVLSQFGFTATVFLPTAYISDSRKQFKGTDCLMWPEIRELQKHRISFGSHTVSHPRLSELNEQTIREELGRSKDTIEHHLSSAVESFSYPFAFPQTETQFTDKFRQLLLQANYKNGVCTMVGRASRKSDPFFMERLPVNSSDDEALLEAKLRGAYDWMAKTQYLVQLGKRRFAKFSSVKLNPAVSSG